MRNLLVIILLIIIANALCGIKNNLSKTHESKIVEKVDTTFNEQGIRIPKSNNPSFIIDSSGLRLE